MRRTLLIVAASLATGFLLGSFLACQECFSLGSAGENFRHCLKNLIDGLLAQ